MEKNKEKEGQFMAGEKKQVGDFATNGYGVINAPNGVKNPVGSDVITGDDLRVKGGK